MAVATPKTALQAFFSLLHNVRAQRAAKPSAAAKGWASTSLCPMPVVVDGLPALLGKITEFAQERLPSKEIITKPFDKPVAPSLWVTHADDSVAGTLSHCWRIGPLNEFLDEGSDVAGGSIPAKDYDLLPQRFEFSDVHLLTPNVEAEPEPQAIGSSDRLCRARSKALRWRWPTAYRSCTHEAFG
ncbi:hypothetical protein [Paucibacter sp. B51]|nr:hypothetical protein [Paucibacter sp. B51]